MDLGGGVACMQRDRSPTSYGVWVVDVVVAASVGDKIRKLPDQILEEVENKISKTFNKYTSFDSFGYSDLDDSYGYSNLDNSYGSPSSLPLPPFNSLAPQPTLSSSIAPLNLTPPSIGGNPFS
ncbi:hypothetical protein JHK82_034937 [Glycine max]|nr:hypothetical protein JHK87_034878 [Glycine soja]KAG4969226.1 hypothetical protein JHK85_035647 [Glycine max]KAG5111668.1 hypothetical protein JHK82_034937 [Glycine max]